ncbi:MAG: ABC transporter ATP-binding protein [Weissella confusa]
MSNTLLIENLSVRYHSQQILHDVSINIPTGSIFSLLGDNGAGKTTLLKTILGLNKHFSGSMTYNEQPLSREQAKDFGALIESPAIYPNLTAQENLRIMALLYNLSEPSISATLHEVGLGDVSKKLKVKNFSLGMKQRLGIAMAIIHNPKFLILDEPTNGLDMAGVDDFKTIVHTLAASGMTIMITTHQITELATAFDAFAILQHGKITYASNSGGYSAEELTTIYRDYND